MIPVEIPVSEKNILQDQVAFISGGDGGIGVAIAKSFLESGCRVIIGGTNKENLNKCKNHLSKWSTNVKIIKFDLEDVENLDKSLRNVIASFGRIDIFVNAAGVHIENVDFWNIRPDQYDKVMNINLRGVYFSCIELAKYWKESNKKGHILLISSSRGSEPAWSPYGISKWGINGMTQGLAQVLIKDNIVVNAIAPGSTATPLLGIFNKNDSIFTNDNVYQRMVLPNEIGTYAKLLVSGAGDMLIGETVHVSAGRGVWDIH
ncbi:SDR family oxidoreductase [Limosilactobacillus vaginalis]|uniref:SDR family NAD(P)-dependent oxidoreductase n=1 Tax=Limosilactobacillus vaginalis TaxID=1633 RepID=UPI002FDB61E6